LLLFKQKIIVIYFFHNISINKLYFILINVKFVKNTIKLKKIYARKRNLLIILIFWLKNFFKIYLQSNLIKNILICVIKLFFYYNKNKHYFVLVRQEKIILKNYIIF